MLSQISIIHLVRDANSVFATADSFIIAEIIADSIKEITVAATAALAVLCIEHTTLLSTS